jgi:Signal transduction histidine kinase
LSIKRRLFLSNFLIAVLVLSAIFISILVDRIGTVDPTSKDTNLFYDTINFMQTSKGEWQKTFNPAQIIADMKQAGLQNSSLSFALYENDVLLDTIGDVPSDILLASAIHQHNPSHFVIGHTVSYSMQIDEYHLILTSTAYEQRNTESKINLFPLFLMLVVMIVLQLINRMLFQSIIVPLLSLEDGLNEIRDGNLSFRIQYDGKDEFASIGSNFNEMAGQLQHLIDAKQKNDKGRKELIAGISHDLRTPLTSIKGYAEGLTKGIATTSDMQKEYAQTIVEKTTDLEHIVNQLFLFSKLDTEDFPLSLKMVDMGEMLMQYIQNNVTVYKKRGLQIVSGDIQGNAIAQVDVAQLRNVFTNLLENTVKYGAKRQNMLHIDCKSVEADVHITFHDNGPGVAPDKLKKLFHAFYRTDNARNNPRLGSGLGLAISRRIIETMGGSINAENDCGLKIIIILPRTQGGLNEENIDY